MMRSSLAPRPLRTAACLGALLLTIGGCAKFTADGGMAPVSAEVATGLSKQATKISSPQEAAAAQARVKSLLSASLSADSAVQVMLLNNRALQAEYNALGVAEADYVEATLPPAPIITLELLWGAGFFDTERRLIANVLALATLPKRQKIAAVEFQAAQYKAVEATFRLAAETRRAYFRAVAARQTVNFLTRARTSADAAADLTRRLGETGAATKLDQARASAFYAEVSNQLARARMRADMERETLTRLLGLWGNGTDFKLPASLPDLPKRLTAAERIEAEAVRRRVDLIVARLELDAMAQRLGLTEATRYVSLFDLTGISNYGRVEETGIDEEEFPTGFEVELQIPIFDMGEARTRRARETYKGAVNRLAARAIDVRSEVRSAYVAYRGSYDISRQYRNSILPLRQTINEQALLEYNGMLIDVFDLLTTARESIASNVAAIEAKRDFFLAEVDFQVSILGGGGGGGGAGGEAAAAAAEPAGH